MELNSTLIWIWKSQDGNFPLKSNLRGFILGLRYIIIILQRESIFSYFTSIISYIYSKLFKKHPHFKNIHILKIKIDAK